MEQLRRVYADADHFQHAAVVTRETLEAKRECSAFAERIVLATGTKPSPCPLPPPDVGEGSRSGTASPPLQRSRAVLDIGSGEGGFAYHLAQRGYGPVTIVDLDPRAAEAATLIPDCAFRQCAFEDVEVTAGPFAVIVMSQILEHAIDPLDWLRRARSLIAPDGVLAIALPNFGGIYRLLGERDPMIIPPVHLNYFTLKSLTLALDARGFEVRSWNTLSRIQSSGGGLSAKRALMGRLWNAGSWLLNPTPWGIILNVFASPQHGE
jgi:2-polyprenyl-3-methyl-5-hydroxy-6-metoxy-1,4-benzoquinol methylase